MGGTMLNDETALKTARESGVTKADRPRHACKDAARLTNLNESAMSARKEAECGRVCSCGVSKYNV
ncbi:uncharacterized protein PHACADRAFT_253546 [Phanerochaete carnosa HHB-10118-sp]|uniref:Uncharacterized protein n=1 Tax=Phanerochaete carnosa (strain HHB-10118-sp) TaxID=650164 RepID=K5VXY8_PHACS|nr:uncharacterized protein PHACADRAFT_253546 [Phanerochaete carnosa HHB-10118-sp]EKM56433.1 hypothetical protein PHACADRAFT_253546 [Phanerochaete carnosa HHB-10118-sp]